MLVGRRKDGQVSYAVERLDETLSVDGSNRFATRNERNWHEQQEMGQVVDHSGPKVLYTPNVVFLESQNDKS